MAVIEEFISIQTSPANVERYLTDEIRSQQWISPLAMVELASGEWMKVGSTYRLRLKTLAMMVGAIYTLVERDKNHIRLDFEGFWQGSDSWSWFADGSRTIVQNRVEYELTNPWLRTLLGPFLFLFLQFDMRIQMVQLQRLVEGTRHQLPEPEKRPVEEKR